jgi:hypothetical protein
MGTPPFNKEDNPYAAISVESASAATPNQGQSRKAV